MREERGNLWDFYKQPNAVVCITTNGTVKNNGECVMGRGCAKQATRRVSGIASILGAAIQGGGNKVHPLVDRLVSFPVKHNWWELADLALIRRSAEELKVLVQDTEYSHYTFYLPRPGCGNGHRDWETQVKPVLEDVGLPDNVVIVTF